MAKDNINLDGSEVSIIKALGFASGIAGIELKERLPDLTPSEIADTLRTLIAIGYVESDKSSFTKVEEFDKTHFHVNSGYAKELKDSMNPNQNEKPKSRRMRRE